MKCAGCMKNIKESDLVKCTSNECGKAFCKLCVNVPAERKKQWMCPDCASLKRVGDNSQTPVQGTRDHVTHRKKTDSSGSEANANQALAEQLRVITSQYSAVMEKLEDISQSLSFNNDRLEEVLKLYKEADARIRYLEKRDKEVEVLQANLSQVQEQLHIQAQANLRNEIEIVGIPETMSENLYHTVLVAAKKVGIELDANDVDWVTRVGPRRPPVSAALPEDGAVMPRPVVVRLLRRTKRDQFLKAAKSRRNLKSSDLGVDGAPRQLYFNDRLTKENRVLFRDARSRAKQLGYAFCWSNQGSIYVRKSEGTPPVPIRSQRELDRLLPAPATSATS